MNSKNTGKKSMTYELVLPLPPSMNVVYTYNPYIRQKVYKKSGTSYLTVNTAAVQEWVAKNKFPMQEDYFYLDMWFWVPRRNADSHNYKKLLLDVLEHGGLVVNDKFIMDRTQGIDVDREDPRCKMIITLI